jgi:hypothetical protein
MIRVHSGRHRPVVQARHQVVLRVQISGEQRVIYSKYRLR